MLSVVPWAINRSTALWGPDALEFNPYRWIDKESGKANNAGGAESNYALLTFLHGPRSCIGERFARAELKALVAVFVGGFELGIVPETGVPVPAGAITTKPKDGMRLLVRPVPGW
jgi:cytochrome P450